ncbi:hypothetical protein BY458DRAFT_534609 [Sporodiniella umbellata]|nr:hypothetical protein BY458DRAFT_534609 [Sporodiniella umbellata]
MVFQINSQVTDPLIETVNDLSRLILPVMISQALTGAYKRRSNEVASRPEHLIEENATESDDEDIRVPRASDYIDVTEQGTITNASRLDRVLKNRERAKKKRKQQQQSTNDGLDISYLFGPHLSIQERDAKFQEFKLPPLPRDQLTATLTALNILLENDQVIGSVMTGKHNGSHSALLDMMDDVVAEDPSEASTVYSRLNPTGHRPLTHTPHYAAENMTLPIHIQYVIRHLVHLVIYPTLDAWAESRWSHHSLTSLTETKANSMYQDVLQWIYRFSEFPKRGQEALQRPRFHENRTGSSHIGDTSSEEDEEGPLFSSYTKKKQEDSQQSSQTSKKYHGFSRRALILLQSLTRYASVRHYLIQDLQFLKVLFYLLEADSTPTERVMTCLGTLFAHDPQVRIPKHEFQILAILVWHSVLFSKSRSFYFYSRFVLTYCSRSVTDRATAQMINHASCVEIDLVSRSKFCLIDYASCLHVRNDSWTFETVRATHGVSSLKKDSKGQCYAYEVRLESGGLMQVGWVTDHFEFDPEGGKGVGDDIHSFGYDGSRAKKWHGKYANMRTTTYGMIWHEGDTVTCAIDLEKGEISYYLNGTDMGVAFFNIAGNRSWYPAVSLATGQQCKLQFGGPTDPLKHLPEGYLAISTLASQSLFNMELPPPRMAKQVSLEDSDLSDLSKAMEHMSFKSPVLNDGNTEPSLKPIDSIEPIQDISIRSEQFSFYFMKSSPHEQNTLSSVYYEIALEFYKEDSLNVSSLNESVFKFGLQCLGPQAFICFEYHTVQKYLTFVIGSDRSEAFEFEIADGDRIGLLYVNETNAFGVTLNGQVQFFIYVGKNVSFEPYIPFVSGLMRNNVNYGEEPFAWVFANHPSSKQHRLSYLYSLVGKISEF